MADIKHDIELSSLNPVMDQLNAGLREVYEYWLRLCVGRDMPSWSCFDWMELPASVIPWCVVVDAVGDPPDFIYRFWGTARTQLQGRDYTGYSIRDVTPQELSDKIYKEYRDVWERRKPVHFVTTEFANRDGKKFEYHFLRLPFSRDGRQVTQIFAVGIHEETDIKIIQNFFLPHT